MTVFRSLLAVSLMCAGIPGVASLRAQTADAASASKDAAAPLTFKSGVNLVQVPVVVRDGRGRAMGDLQVTDFQLFDNGKPQMIAKFTVEKLAGSAASTAAPPKEKPAGGEVLADAESDGIPERFVAYLFDDLHMSFSDLVRTRDAARRQIDQSLHALDRAAIYTTSGRQMTEFTGDLDKLHATLAAISIGEADEQRANQQSLCPPMTYYMGDLIENVGDPDALNVAATDALALCNINPPDITQARLVAHATARTVVALGDTDTVSALETLRLAVNRMSAMPGQRSIVLISPGFLVTRDRYDDMNRLLERALRASVVIGALDARGLYTNSGTDASERTVNIATMSAKILYAAQGDRAQADIMAFLSSGTGGEFYENSNNYDEGLARVASAPEYLYVLGFNPLALKPDGRYHNLKVVVTRAKGLSLEARKGYYAPRSVANPAEQGKQQVEDTFFSRDEVHDLPAVLQTQYFKSGNGDATLSAVAKIDVKKLAFHKDADRNRNEVTVVTGLFDNNGNYIDGKRQVVQMRLLDDTLANRVGGGIAVRSSFTVHPGRYMVRMVVRDTEGQLMSAQSSMVEIP